MFGFGFDFTLLRRRRNAAFNPAASFAGSEQGFVLDFTDVTKLFQTNDTSTPVTTNGQAIGRATDLSGKNNHATQATAGNRPVYNGNGTFITDDRLLTPAMNMSASAKLTLMFSVRVAGTTNQTVCAIGTAGSGRCDALFQAGAAPNMRGQLLGSGGPSQITIVGDTAATINRVYEFEFDIAGAAAADEIKIWKDSVFPTQTVAAAGPAGTGNFGAALTGIIGDAAGSTTFPLNGVIGRIMAINRLLTAPEKAAWRTWIGAGLGVVL